MPLKFIYYSKARYIDIGFENYIFQDGFIYNVVFMKSYNCISWSFVTYVTSDLFYMVTYQLVTM